MDIKGALTLLYAEPWAQRVLVCALRGQCC